jgi:hypothetical protein
MMIIEAYQTLEDRDNIDEIEMEGPYKCNRSDAWLGNGYYFWDTNMHWAIGWGETSYNNRGMDFVIARCNLDLSNCFDLLGNVQHQVDLIECIKVFRASMKIKATREPLIPELIEFLKRNELFPYNSIRSSDNPDSKSFLYVSNRNNFVVVNQRVQVCVIKKRNVLLRPFKVIYPEKYLY